MRWLSITFSLVNSCYQRMSSISSSIQNYVCKFTYRSTSRAAVPPSPTIISTSLRINALIRSSVSQDSPASSTTANQRKLYRIQTRHSEHLTPIVPEFHCEEFICTSMESADLFKQALSSSSFLTTFNEFRSEKIVAAAPHEGKKQNDFKTLLQDIVCGGAAGVVGQSMVFPLYTAKTNLQSSPKVYNRGLLQCLRDIATKQGIRGLYTGMRPTVTMTFPEKAIKLAANDYFKKKLATDEGEVPLARGMLAGAGAGFCQVIVTNPMELLMITMQTRAASGIATAKNVVAATETGAVAQKVSVPSQGMFAIARELGVRRLYADIPATLLRDIPFSVIFFPMHTYLTECFQNEEGRTPVAGVLASGFLSGSTAATLSTPMDVVKTRVMAATGKAGPGEQDVSQVTRIVRTFGEVYKTSGMRGLFAGTGPRILIISPLFGITTMVYEVLKKLRDSGRL